MSLVTKIKQRAEAENGLHYRNPAVPHACCIPGSLAIGTKIYFLGTVPPECRRFTLDLQRGTGDETDIFFHFDVRLQEALVVRNSRGSNIWHQEEREGDIPFTSSHTFLVVISAFHEILEVEVNGKLFTTFKMREGMPVTNITHLSIWGDVIINALHIPLETFPKHLRLSIPNKTKVGDVFTLRGRVPSGAENFVVNLQCGPGQSDDVVFHFNPRMGDEVVVRNTRADDEWSEEERGGGMPFTVGDPFQLVIATGRDAFYTWVNGQEFVKFAHRLDMTNACTLYVEGEADLRDICIDSVANRLPPQSDDNAIRSFQNADPVLFNPPLPVVHQIPNGIKPGKIVAISGTTNKDAKTFSVNLQCDATDDASIAYHFNPRFEDAVVVQNSRDNDKWDDEVRPSIDFPFLPGTPFDLQILCTPSGGYFATVDGFANADFPSRLDYTRVDHLMIEGDLQVQRILIL